MAKTDHLEATKWKPGQSGNISGKPKQLLTKDKVSALMGKFSLMSRRELKDFVANDDAPIVEVAVAAIYLKAASDGDFTRLNFLLDRSIGKVKDEIEQTVKSISDEELDKIPREQIVRLITGT